MQSAAKPSSLQAYHLVLFRGALHPEFFGIEGRRRIEHADYGFDAWIFKGGHVLTFHSDGLVLTEIITERIEGLPERGRLACLPCAGERDHEEALADRVQLVTSIQTETLSDHLYLATHAEMVEHGRQSNALLTSWQEHGGQKNLSVIDIQRHRGEIHVQGYHLRSDCAMVLRSQSIFSVEPVVAR